MFIAFGELTPLSWGLIGLLVFFVIQILLCFKAKRKLIKLLPAYIIIAALIFALMTSIGSFGSYSAGAISGDGIVGAVIAAVAGIAAIGAALAWVVYGIALLMKRSKKI